MSNTSVAATRFGMSASACRLGMLAVGSRSTAHAAVATTYTPFIDARNGAQGGAAAWSPPVC